MGGRDVESLMREYLTAFLRILLFRTFVLVMKIPISRLLFDVSHCVFRWHFICFTCAFRFL
jgi:hypothetical protein